MYRNESNNLNHPIIQAPSLFQDKLIVVFQASSTHISNVPTPTPCGARTGNAKRLIAFDYLCRATARVAERLLAYYRRFRTSTRLLQSFLNIN